MKHVHVHELQHQTKSRHPGMCNQLRNGAAPEFRGDTDTEYACTLECWNAAHLVLVSASM